MSQRRVNDSDKTHDASRSSRVVRFASETDEAELGYELDDLERVDQSDRLIGNGPSPRSSTHSHSPSTRLSRLILSWRQTRLGFKLLLALIPLWGLFLLFTSPSYIPIEKHLPPPYDYPAPSASDLIDHLYSRQSTTLAQAQARYTLRAPFAPGPPPHFDQWFKFAKQRKCLIDEFDQVYRDFEPFYQLERQKPGRFKEMLKNIRGKNLQWITIRAGRVVIEKGFDYDHEWRAILQRISPILPNMRFIINTLDEPRVAFNYRTPTAFETALNHPFTDWFFHDPRPTSKFFLDQKACLVRADPESGFGFLANDDSAFLLNAATAQFTTDLYPVLSQARVSPCFSDIIIPSLFYYNNSGFAPKYRYPDDVPWEKKLSKLYWRGSASGGLITPSNYAKFPRFHLVDLARNHSSSFPQNEHLFDVALTDVPDANCGAGCTPAFRKKLMDEYEIVQTPPFVGNEDLALEFQRYRKGKDASWNQGGRMGREEIEIENENEQNDENENEVNGMKITKRGRKEPREQTYRFKYALDLDGNSYSGRFLGLMRSGSLVFRSTIFTTSITPYFRPYEHYIPILPDLSDLVQKLTWAKTHDKEAKMIQLQGEQVARRIIGEDSAMMDCYFSAVLLEWARLSGVEGVDH